MNNMVDVVMLIGVMRLPVLFCVIFWAIYG
jgi:hypothetical protein